MYNTKQICLSEVQLNNLFPFFILINRNLEVVASGKSLLKLINVKKGVRFNEFFSIPRPHTPITQLNDLIAAQNQMVVLEPAQNKSTLLRGQFEYLTQTSEILFVGSPWFGSIEQVKENNLIIDDFARHDPLIDLLHVLKSQEINNEDLKQLLSTINRQKKEIKHVSKEVNDIALFTTQNPDPIIRINFEGDVLKNNPAASRLDFMEYQNKFYRNDIFFKLIADTIDKKSERWMVEAKSGKIDYSFVCIPLHEEGYINIYGRDITQKKADEEQLERLSLVASANQNGVVFTDESGKIFWCNDGIEEISGYTKAEIIGKTPVEVLRGPFTDSAVIKSMVDDFYNLRPFNNELIQYKKDGSWYWGKTKGQPVKSKNGKIRSYFAIIEDISADKQNEEQLRILSSIAEENTHGVVIASHDGKVEWVNKSFEKLTGYTLEEMVGKKPGHILQGPETNPETIAYLGHQIKNGEPFVCEILNYHKQGGTYWLRLQGQALKSKNGKVTKYFAIEEDVTKEKKINEQLKEFESKFKLALEKIGDNVWEHDFRTGITQFSKQENNFFGLEKSDIKNLEKIWWNSIYAPDLPTIEENDRRYRNGEIDFHILEYRIIKPDGKKIWILDRGVVLEKDANNKPLLIIGTHTDITNHKNIEQELLVAKNAAEASKKAKEVFLANMSHEIRTPMNAIIGMGNQLKKTQLTSQQQFQLNTINAAAENLLVIINDILDLSKIEAGKLAVEKIGFEPKKVVGNAMQVLMYKAEEKGLSLTNSFCDHRLQDVLIGDPYRLNQVMLNLISNAIKFTERGSVDVTCKVADESTETQTIEASVIDTGIGMEQNYVEKLFDKFSQEYESVTRKFGGTGLGMSICKELIGLMGGDIKVKSKKGEGTTVSFTITFTKGKQSDLPELTEIAIGQDFLSGKTILVTDDNEMNRLVASTILKSYGANIVEATNGEQALEVVKATNPHLILMDIQMPLLNGYDATKRLRKSGNNIPVIALTANAIRGENEKCIEAGMNDYIAKPFKEDIFLQKIAQWLNINYVYNATRPLQNDGNEKMYDLSGIEEIGKGNAAFVNKMIVLFCEQTPLAVSEMKNAFEANDLEKVGALAHKLKPSIDNLKITALRQVIRDIEKSGKEKNNTSELKTQILVTEEIIAKTVSMLKQELSK
jgi:PAS domain S-box-containing protein